MSLQKKTLSHVHVDYRIVYKLIMSCLSTKTCIKFRTVNG